MEPLLYVANFTTSWLQTHLHQLQIWPPGGATCVDCKFGYQMAELASVAISAELAFATANLEQACHLGLVLAVEIAIFGPLGPWIGA